MITDNKHNKAGIKKEMNGDAGAGRKLPQASMVIEDSKNVK